MDKWDFVFLQLVGWTLHPGYLREGAKAPSLSELADLADRVVAISEDRSWQDGQQQQP